MQVAIPAAVRGPAFDALLELLQAEVNVKRVEVVVSDTSLVRLRAKANFPIVWILKINVRSADDLGALCRGLDRPGPRVMGVGKFSLVLRSTKP